MSNQRVFFATILAVLVFALPGFAQDTDGDGMSDAFEMSYAPTTFAFLAGDSRVWSPGRVGSCHGGYYFNKI